MWRKILLPLLLLAATTHTWASSLTLFPPLSRQGNLTATAALLFVPGALTSAEAYESLLHQVQKVAADRYQLRLWVCIPKYPFNIAPRAEQPFAKAVQNSLRNLFDQIQEHDGQPVDFVFFGGHSRGAKMVQDALFNALKHKWDRNDPIVKFPLGGLISLSTSLGQKQFAMARAGSVKTLTISGELDGLFRVFRLAESFYSQIVSAIDAESAFVDSAVLTIRGACHSSFITGKPPVLVRLNDLKPEKTAQQVIAVASEMIADFLGAHAARSEQGRQAGRQSMKVLGTESAEYFSYIIGAMQLEGSLQPASGSPWVEYAQTVMGQLDIINYMVHDSFIRMRPTSLPPLVRAPQILNNCEEATKACKLNITTFSQLIFHPFENGTMDTGFYPISAVEIRAKLRSRQAIHFAAGIKSANFTELDDRDDVCQLINQRAWIWALDNAHPSVLRRFYERDAVPLLMETDRRCSALTADWTWSSLSYQRRFDSVLQKWLVDVRAPTVRTSIRQPFTGGLHYCKLLSPARALEWIYVDSLKTE